MSRFALKPLAAIAAATSAVFMALTPAPAQAVTTSGVLTYTAAALPSCLAYRVEGICFFLRCKLLVCWIETSIKISHYVPDVVVSTYNDPLRHPWTDLGAPVATAVGAAGSTIMGRLLDSSAGGLDTTSAMTNYKSADAIGNPATMLASMATGGMPSMPTTLPIPGTTELAKFTNQELPNIGRQWTQVPQEVMNTVASDSKKMLEAPGQLLAGLQTIMKSIDGVRQVIEIAEVVEQVQGGMEAFEKVGSMLSDLSGGSMLFCPGGSSPFYLHYQSELDAPFWRGVLPLEMLYPQSWVPGLGEVGSGYTQTWGPTYPRTGELIQSHPVKTSAVLSERVASILYKSAQPHVYTKVEPSDNGQVYFGGGGHMWQMLHPSPATNCLTFGTNDSLSLTTFGDGKTDPADGYSWNLWKRYICCQRRGAFLFSIP
ncbi:TraU family protein [Alicycliphilus denitrificans]|uniref:TraU family protein n=1 Tax=Alicycliphilus denitrificans TaxID=179636 RepID=UPI00384AB925